MSKTKILFSLLCLLIVAILGAIVYLYSTFHTPPNIQREKDFLWNLYRQPDIASDYLSIRAQSEVVRNCPKSSLIGCTTNLIPASWGSLDDIKFGYGKPSINSTIYYSFWSNLNQPIVIVIIGKEENGQWVIDGWRGFVVSQGEDADSKLLNGIRHDNEFPKSSIP